MDEDASRELSDDEAWEIVLDDHPEWKEEYLEGTLPHEIVGEGGEPMNPHMHLMIHVIVEKQLAADDPSGIVAVADELAGRGISRHEVRHAIGMAVAEQLFGAMQSNKEFDAPTYFAQIREIVDEYY